MLVARAHEEDDGGGVGDGGEGEGLLLHLAADPVPPPRPVLHLVHNIVQYSTVQYSTVLHLVAAQGTGTHTVRLAPADRDGGHSWGHSKIDGG